MKRYVPFIFVTIAICLFTIPYTSNANIIRSQQVINTAINVQASPNYAFQEIGNGITDNIYSVQVYEDTYLGGGHNQYLTIVTCNTNNIHDASCSSYQSDASTASNSNAYPLVYTLTNYYWTTPVVTLNKYIFIKFLPWTVSDGGSRSVYGSTSDSYPSYACKMYYSGSDHLCSDSTTVQDLYFVIAGSDSVYITQPPNGSTWFVNPQGFVSSIPDSVASTTIKWNVRFGQLSNTYTETSDYGFINYTAITGEYMIPTNYPFALSATSTWYLRPYIYADYNNDGTWSLVYTGNETSFTVAPASVVYSGGYSGLDGQMHYYNLSPGFTGLEATTSVACDTWDIKVICYALQWAFVPPDCILANLQGEISCTSFTRFSTLLDRYTDKAPWGYYGRFKQLVDNMASSSSATSTFSGLTDWLPTNGPLYTFIDYFKTGTAVLIWFTSVAFTLKIATLFL